MLKSVDVLIGLTVVLLALSMAVTVITQSLTTLINSRGRHLRRGLTDLLQQLDPKLTPAVSKAIATEILTHPLVSGSAAPFASTDGAGWLGAIGRQIRRLAGGPRLGNVVHREEFTKLLMAVGAGQGSALLQEHARTALAGALSNNGVTNPEDTLRRIRDTALRLERTSPELSNMARQNIAILHAAESDLVAKINNWFDQTMDRTSQRFTASTRAITFAGAFLVAFGLQVDTPAVVNRLAADDALRAAFVQEAQALYKDQQAIEAAQQRRLAAERAAAQGTGPVGEPQGAAPALPAPTAPEEIARKYRAFLATNGLISLPSTSDWAKNFANVNPFGMLLTALLLSLGAPFWYNALDKLLRLRSVLAAKDDAQRRERQSHEQAPPPGPASRRAAPGAPAGGSDVAVL
jgi:hypothetical protein